jgi:hypothetical protein
LPTPKRTSFGVQDDPELHLHFVRRVASRIPDGTQLTHQAGRHRPCLFQGVFEGSLRTFDYGRSRQATPRFTSQPHIFDLDKDRLTALGWEFHKALHRFLLTTTVTLPQLLYSISNFPRLGLRPR